MSFRVNLLFRLVCDIGEFLSYFDCSRRFLLSGGAEQYEITCGLVHLHDIKEW